MKNHYDDPAGARSVLNGFARAMTHTLDDIRSALAPESGDASDICIEVEEKTGCARVLIGCTVPGINEKLSGGMREALSKSENGPDADAAVYAHLAKTLVEELGGEFDADGPEKCAAFTMRFKTLA